MSSAALNQAHLLGTDNVHVSPLEGMHRLAFFSRRSGLLYTSFLSCMRKDVSNFFQEEPSRHNHWLFPALLPVECTYRPAEQLDPRFVALSIFEDESGCEITIKDLAVAILERPFHDSQHHQVIAGGTCAVYFVDMMHARFHCAP